MQQLVWKPPADFTAVNKAAFTNLGVHQASLHPGHDGYQWIEGHRAVHPAALADRPGHDHDQVHPEPGAEPGPLAGHLVARHDRAPAEGRRAAFATRDLAGPRGHPRRGRGTFGNYGPGGHDRRGGRPDQGRQGGPGGAGRGRGSRERGERGDRRGQAAPDLFRAGLRRVPGALQPAGADHLPDPGHGVPVEQRAQRHHARPGRRRGRHGRADHRPTAQPARRALQRGERGGPDRAGAGGRAPAGRPAGRHGDRGQQERDERRDRSHAAVPPWHPGHDHD